MRKNRIKYFKTLAVFLLLSSCQTCQTLGKVFRGRGTYVDKKDVKIKVKNSQKINIYLLKDSIVIDTTYPL